MDNENDKIFQVSVKGLFFNDENKLMLAQQKDGDWEPPGGRIQKGEDLIGCLKREVLEEMGLTCEALESQPSIVYSAIDQRGRARLMVYYKIHFDGLEFKPSDECIDIKFFTKEEICNLNMAPQIKPLPDFL